MKSRYIVMAALLLVQGASYHAPTRAQGPVEAPPKASDTRKMTAFPDLAVVGMEVLNPDTGKFKVIVVNKGKGKADWAELRLMVWDATGKIYFIFGISQPALAPGVKQPVTFEVGMPVSSMKYELFTDYTKRVGESNELNNIYKGYISKY